MTSLIGLGEHESDGRTRGSGLPHEARLFRGPDRSTGAGGPTAASQPVIGVRSKALGIRRIRQPRGPKGTPRNRLRSGYSSEPRKPGVRPRPHPPPHLPPPLHRLEPQPPQHRICPQRRLLAQQDVPENPYVIEQNAPPVPAPTFE